MLTLCNGMKIANRGLGARSIWERDSSREKELMAEEYEFYLYAISTGLCSLFDTSDAYGKNIESLGRAIKDSKTRDSVRVMTKISNAQQREGNLRKTFEKHLKRLNTDYVDYYLMHWPYPDRFTSTWKEMEKIYEDGLAKAIGVCNFKIHHFRELAVRSNIQPMINQIEITPIFTQDAIVNYCKAFDIVPVAYSSLGRMHDVLMNGEPIRIIAQKYQKTPAQIVTKWNEKLGRPALIQTRNKKHFCNLFGELNDFTLTEKEVCWINSMNDNIRLRYNPDAADMSFLG